MSDPNGISTSLPYKLDFSCTNNEVEFEALVIGLAFTLRMTIQRLQVLGDLKLIIKQVNGGVVLKEIGLVLYRTTIQKLVKTFEDILF